MTTDGNSIAPSFAPHDKSLLAFTRQNYTGIYLLRTDSLNSLSSAGRSPVALSDKDRAGFEFSWSGNGENIIARFEESNVLQTGIISVNNGQMTALSSGSQDASVPVIRRNHVFFIEGSESIQVDLGMASTQRAGSFRALRATTSAQPITVKDGHIFIAESLISRRDSTCWLPTVSPDGEKIAYECWEGVYLYQVTPRVLVFVGRGNSPRWSSDSQHVVFERTEDDPESHYLIKASDAMMVRYDGSNLTNLTADTDIVVRRPSLSADSHQIAVDVDGDIYIADLATEGQSQ